jgi:hypothetical protein
LHTSTLVAVWLGTALFASCGVDKTGLGTMPFLPRDASSSDGAQTGTGGGSGSAGAAGASGAAGIGGNVTGAGGASAGGTGGNDPAGSAGSGGAAGALGAAGTGGDASGAAGTDGGGTGGTDPAGVGGTGGDASGAAGTGGGGGTGGTGGGVGGMGVAGTGGGTAGFGGGSGGGGRGGAAGRGGTGGIGNCTALNCSDGCCSNGTCVRERTVLQCGSQGQACAPCGGCQTCSATGQCRIEPESRWTIVAVSAQLDANSWDRFNGDVGGSAPDPFCEFENPAGQVTPTTAGVTDTKQDTYNPTWNQTISPAGMTVSAVTLMASSPAWQIWVGDDDCESGQNCVADVACRIRQPITETNLRSGQLVVTNRDECNRVIIDFHCQPGALASEAP